ncbi:hypothetical protein [Inquilinus sp.]|jgi:hypothetical protein|uniref:hypothetical protein n=1 Tax=Inquilinus sp. TaxID=1932117 RepID=UPI003783B9F1
MDPEDAMAFVIPGTLLLFTILLVVLPWRVGVAVTIVFSVGVIGTLFVLTLHWRAQAERSWRKLVYNTQLRAGATPEEAKARAEKARLDWGSVDS